MYRERGNHIITEVTEHKAVLDTCKKLEKAGFPRYLPARDRVTAWWTMEELEALPWTDQTILVSIMYANNEIGVDSARFKRDRRALPQEVASSSTRTLCRRWARSPSTLCRPTTSTCSPFPAHKIYGPKGVGALYVRRRNPRVQISEQHQWRRP